MLFMVCAALAFGAVLRIALKGAYAPRSLWASEQTAHSEAATRRARTGENRRERRHSAGRSEGTWSILGQPERRVSCRVVNVSRSGLRVASAQDLPKGEQVHVQWGDEFFIGTVQYTLAQGGAYVAGMQLISGNYRRQGGVVLRLSWRAKKTSAHAVEAVAARSILGASPLEIGILKS